MWRSDLCEAVVALPLPADGSRLPISLTPQPSEALVSWICRMAAALNLSPGSFARCAFGLGPELGKDWWRRPPAYVLARMARRTNLSVDRLIAMTFIGWSTARADEIPERLNTRCFPLMEFGSQGAPGVCPECLHEDERPYLRLAWLAGWCGVCPKHQAILTTFCPSCLARLRNPLVTTNLIIDLGRCARCGLMLGSTLREPAQPAALHLQRNLLEIKRNGSGILPGIGQLDWGMAMALIDVLLHLVWTQTGCQDVEELFARIATDYALDADALAFTPWERNYGSLLILAWLFESFEDRLSFAIDTLQNRRLGQLIRWLPGASQDQRARLKMILAPGLAKRPSVPKPWQIWLSTLPPAAELMARAARAPHLYACERLVALATLRSGASLRAVANELRWCPTRLRAWLDEGVRVGLEALLVPMRQPHRQPDAPGDIAAVSAWLSGVYHPSCGFHLWTVANLTAAMKRNLGIRLSPAGARSVIAADRARRRPQYYQRLAWRRRRMRPFVRRQRYVLP